MNAARRPLTSRTWSSTTRRLKIEYADSAHTHAKQTTRCPATRASTPRKRRRTIFKRPQDPWSKHRSLKATDGDRISSHHKDHSGRRSEETAGPVDCPHKDHA